MIAKLCLAAAQTRSIELKGLLCAGRNTGKKLLSRNFRLFLLVCAPWLSIIKTGRLLPLNPHLTCIRTFIKNCLNSTALVDFPSMNTALLRADPIAPNMVMYWGRLLICTSIGSSADDHVFLTLQPWPWAANEVSSTYIIGWFLYNI